MLESRLRYLCIIPYCVLWLFSNDVKANNASYIALSSQIAHKTQLEVIANNVANISTTGFEQDAVAMSNVDVIQGRNRYNSFVRVDRTYRSGDQGGLKITNRPTDVAVSRGGYFKLLTPRGIRYSLDGSIFINNQGMLVNAQGDFFLSADNTVIQIPDNFQTIDILQDGSIIIDKEDTEIAILGVFGFDMDNVIIKEGGNLYVGQGNDRLLEEFVLIVGALRQSNVNSTLAMANMVEMQRSYGLITDLMTHINTGETSSIQKLTK